MKPNRKRLLLKLLPYPLLAWVGGLLYFDIERGLLGDVRIYPSTNNPYDPFNSFIGVSIMTITLGTVLGYIEEVIFKNRFKKLPFFFKILVKTVLYVLVVVLLLLVLSFFLNASNMDLSIANRRVLETVMDFFLSFTFLSIVIFSGAMISVSLFFSEIVDFLGIDVVGSFFTGKYAKSVVEDRIFMFLDMKGSTSIAEKLGHEKHYQLINEYYSDMTDAIVRTKGTIYQYVGDEIVVFWNAEGGLSQSNCVRCFFLIKDMIAKRSTDYLSAYGLVPTFKAAIHLGRVTRGQVGLIKRELLFTGDVLNTTARIQSLCNELNASLLISKELKEAIGNGGFTYINKGSFVLKGRDREAVVYQVNQKDA